MSLLLELLEHLLFKNYVIKHILTEFFSAMYCCVAV